jgi:very-short-patch-repair endonuclease
VKRKYWTKDEEEYLINNFSNTMTIELSKALNKTEHSIHMKSYKLGLKKSTSHKSKMISRRNKMVGRDLNYNILKEIAKKYKTRGEFQLNDSSAYSAARKNGYLNNICTHMIKNSYSIPQLLLGEYIKILINDNILYDTRKIIKPYELDIYVPNYKLAFEYDGKGWHLNNKNDEIKNNLCIKHNIKLIRIKENNRKYADDIKNQLIEKINEINNYCYLNIQKESIINIDTNELYKRINYNLLDYNDIKKIISKYSNYHDFIINEKTLYFKLKKLKMLTELTKNLTRKNMIWDNNKIINEISKYEYLLDFIINSKGCYIYIKRHKLEFMLSNLKRKKRG